MDHLTNQLNSSDRIIGLDAMRALLVALGIFLHTGLTHIIHVPGFNIIWPYTTNHSSRFFNFLALWIHTFRMPAFFFLSGFFSYLIYQKRKLSGLILSRFTRIVIPFSIIYASPAVFFMMTRIFLPQLQTTHMTHNILIKLSKTGSMWFLYYLILIDLSVVLLIALIKIIKKIANNNNMIIMQNKKFNKLSLALLLAIPLITLLHTSSWLVTTDINIKPNISLLLYYASFFALGWLIQKHYQYVVEFSRAYWKTLGLVSILASLGVLLLMLLDPNNVIDKTLGGGFYAISTLSMLLAILGGCLKVYKKKNRVLQYLSDSSYWLYITQIPTVLFITGILGNTHLPLMVEYLAEVGLCFAVGLLSYQIIVRKRKIFRYIDCAAQNSKGNQKASSGKTNSADDKTSSLQSDFKGSSSP
jgi:glucans biosynthesis protein C